MATHEDIKLLRNMLYGIGGVLCTLLVSFIVGGLTVANDVAVLKREVVLMREDVGNYNKEVKSITDKVQQLWFMHQKIASFGTNNFKQEDIH